MTLWRFFCSLLVSARQQSCGKVMFSYVLVCLWGVPCDHYLWCIGPLCACPPPRHGTSDPHLQVLTSSETHMVISAPELIGSESFTRWLIEAQVCERVKRYENNVLASLLHRSAKILMNLIIVVTVQVSLPPISVLTTQITVIDWSNIIHR